MTEDDILEGLLSLNLQRKAAEVEAMAPAEESLILEEEETET